MATYASVRELQLNATRVLRDAQTQSDGQAVITSRGKPVALLVPVDPSEVDDLRQAVRARRLRRAVDRLRASARAAGVSEMSMAEINAAIAETRRERDVSGKQ
jgi:prevent-host-death family protein